MKMKTLERLLITFGVLMLFIYALARIHGLVLARMEIERFKSRQLLAQAREKHKAPSCWLIAVMPLWANLHGSFAFGLALAGALAGEAVIEDRKAALGWGLFLLGATVACLATPFGISGSIASLAGKLRRCVAETQLKYRLERRSVSASGR